MPKTADLTLQRWGNSLALRIPSSVAKSVGFTVGSVVEIKTRKSGVVVTAKGEPRLSLSQMLARFDPDMHGGEAMVTTRVGKEAL